MASIEKRVSSKGRATYIVKWRTPDDQHRTRGGFATKRAAEAYKTEVESALLKGLAFDPSAGKVTFREVAREWLESRHDLKVTTHAGHRAALAPAATRRGDGKTLGIDAVFGGYPLNKITRPYINAWVQKMMAAGKKPSTVRHAYFLVRMVLAQAVADGRLASNPADYVKLPSETSAQGGDPGRRRRPGPVPHGGSGFRTRRRNALALQRVRARLRLGRSPRCGVVRVANRRRRASTAEPQPERPAETRPAAGGADVTRRRQ